MAAILYYYYCYCYYLGDPYCDQTIIEQFSAATATAEVVAVEKSNLTKHNQF